jgi:hypothetical protein
LTKNKGGHSSLPERTTPYRLAALAKISGFEFPVDLIEPRAYFSKRALESGAAADMRAVAGSGKAAAIRRLAKRRSTTPSCVPPA